MNCDLKLKWELTFGNVLVAEYALVLVEHDPVLGGASDVVVVGAAVLEALDGGARLLAHLANQVDAVLQRRLHVHQGSGHCAKRTNLNQAGFFLGV